jgi:osmotically-inducible protein OsmY
MFRLRMILTLAVVSLASLGLSGCAATLALMGLKAGTTVAQDRSIGRAIDDATMNTDLNARLANHGLYRQVDTRVVNGRILLSGRVTSDDNRIEAGRLAWDIPGVKEVDNELIVQSGLHLGSRVNDVRISDQLRAKLITDGKIAWVNYNVETVDGTVFLLGMAKDQAELDRVTLHARTIPGVKKVVSYVEMKPAPVEQNASL